MTNDKADDGSSQERPSEGQLGEALRAAYAGPERPEECPSIERWLDWAQSQLDDGEAEAMDRHTEVCGVCRAEAQLASAFVQDDAATDDVSVRRIVRGLERRSPLRKRAPVAPLLAAAAAALFVAIGLWSLNDRREPLPAPSDLTTVRGAELHWETELGEEIPAPTELRWTALEDADRYRVEIVRVDETSVWQEEVLDASVALPQAVREQLEPHVRYRARVTALDPDGRALSRSSPLVFSLREDSRD